MEGFQQRRVKDFVKDHLQVDRTSEAWLTAAFPRRRESQLPQRHNQHSENNDK